HLVERTVLVLQVTARDDVQPVKQRFGLFATVRLDHADNDILALFQPRAGLLEHLIGLADAGGRTEKNLQPASRALLLARLREQGIGRRALVGLTPLIRHAVLSPYAGLNPRQRSLCAGFIQSKI